MRYLILAAAVLMQLCLGATYSWSVYVAELKSLTGLSQGGVQLPFSFFYFIFPLTMVFSGRVLARRGPRFSAMTGGILFGSGWLLAGMGSSSFVLTVAGIGLVAGIGAGLAYIVPISTAIQWFPDKKGLVTGISVAGFGGGAAFVSQVAGRLMSQFGYDPFQVFSVMGGIFLVVICLAGSLMQLPPAAAGEAPETRLTNASEATAPGRGNASQKSPEPLAPWQVLKHPLFRILYFAMFSGLAAGFAVNANLKELYAGPSLQAGITAVSLFALANALGRIIWGALFDRMSPALAVRANLLCQALLMISAGFLLDSTYGFYLFALGTGFNYGGILVLYASSTALCWGDRQMGTIYGWLFSSNIPAALAPVFAGLVFDIGGSFLPAFWIIAGMLVLSVFFVPGQLERSSFH